MEFFNKKEEVIEVQLTEYGKYLLSLGRMRPAYYSFFDDDVQYDTEALEEGGYTEDQNKNKDRIQRNTPKLKISPTRTGAETRVNSYLNAVTQSWSTNSDPASKVEDFRIEAFEEKTRLNSFPIGNSSLSSRYNAAWSLEVLSEPDILTGSTSRYYDDDGLIQNIPQIAIDVDYETLFRRGRITNDSISEYIENSTVFLALKENYLMLEILENNTDFQKENFEIEVFLSGAASSYTQLAYTPESETEFVIPTSENVEYYMNILTDDDIPPEVIAELGISPRAVTTNASRLKLNRDLYTTENEEPC
tara:strand:- start:1373 stop:2287 length:915 start_codon:yes stop_codon:yes gene_type:complete